MSHPRPPHERFLEKIAFCEHGAGCEVCCWGWLAGVHHSHGRFFLRMEGRRGHKRSVHIRADVYFCIVLYGKLPALRVRVKKTCHNEACLNYHHFDVQRPFTCAVLTAYAVEKL